MVFVVIFTLSLFIVVYISVLIYFCNNFGVHVSFSFMWLVQLFAIHSFMKQWHITRGRSTLFFEGKAAHGSQACVGSMQDPTPFQLSYISTPDKSLKSDSFESVKVCYYHGVLQKELKRGFLTVSCHHIFMSKTSSLIATKMHSIGTSGWKQSEDYQVSRWSNVLEG